MPLELCPKCKGMHYTNSPCIVRVNKSTASGKDRIIVRAVRASKPNLRNVPEVVDAQPGKRNAIEALAGTQALPVDTTIPKPKRSGNRHRPGYFTEYMRDYRKGILRRPKAQ